MAATLAGTFTLLRLKWIMRWARLAPPPRWRVVILPWLLRPACFCNLTVIDFSGFVFVISSNVETDMPRRPGVVGRYCLIGISQHLALNPYLQRCCAVLTRSDNAATHSVRTKSSYPSYQKVCKDYAFNASIASPSRMV